jgi:hypothetical protein
MRRPVLLTLAAVGGVIVLLGGTGIFAALSDTTRSGTNSIDTGALAASSDLRVATAVFPGPGFPVSCGSSARLTRRHHFISAYQLIPTKHEYCLLNVIVDGQPQRRGRS